MAIDYFVQNPDVAAAYQANSYGLTPELFASSHYIKYGQYEGRNATPEIVIPPKVDRTLLTTSGVKPVDTSATDVQGDIGATSNNLGAAIPATGLLGASAVAAPLSQEEIVTKIKNQILAQGTTSQWSGQGLGSPEANAADMARLLSDAGITDINQLGKVPVFAPVEPIKTLYNGKQVFTETDEAGKTISYVWEPTGKMLTYNSTDTGEVTYPESRLVTVPKDAKLESVYGVARDSGGEGGGSYYEPIDPSKIKTVDGKLVGDTGQTTFGNKLTGTAIANNYETGADAFGGTFAGKGNTGYRVEFAPNGTPVFYTTGASSSDAADWMPMVQLALAATGAGGLLGNALLGAGAGQVATNALGNAILGGVTTGIAGGDAFKGALLGGAGGALSGYLQGGALDGLGITERQFAIADATQLAEQGLSVSQIRDSLLAGGYNDAIIDRALNALTPATTATVSNPIVDSNTVSIIGTANPSLNNLIGTLAQVPTIDVTAARPDSTSSKIVDVTNALISGAKPPTVEVTAERPVNRDIPVLTSVPAVADPNAPTVKTPAVTPPTTNLSTSDKLRVAQLGLAAAGLLGAGSALSGGGGGATQYPIVDVPADWTSPVRGVAPATTLPPINFGDRNLLIGTQWEKFLDPNYGQVLEPIQYSQPSSLSYNDLMGILGSKQGMPSASTLSINDIISGIQNQYGQARTGTMG